MLQFYSRRYRRRLPGCVTRAAHETNFMETRLILIHQLIKLGVATAVSSNLVRSKESSSRSD